MQRTRYERTPKRKDKRAGYYQRDLETHAGKVKLKVPKLRTIPFDSGIIQRYQRREISIEEALVEMGVSVRRVEDITQALWGTREILCISEGYKEDKAGWLQFLRHLKSRGLKEPRLIISDKCLGLVEALGEIYPNSDWQRCMVHFYRNVLGTVRYLNMDHLKKMDKENAIMAVTAG
ncbi:MAG: transposase [Candidatus Aureabacteria bacterium]|nr:transposase [Candidatus Auribacterota bacterium]